MTSTTFVRWTTWALLCSAFAAPTRAQERSGAYVVRRDTTVIAQETYTFDGTVLTHTLTVPSQNVAIDGTTTYNESLSPLRFQSQLRSVGDTAPLQTLTVAFADSATWRIEGANPSSGSTPLTRPYSVFRNLAFSHRAVLLRRYDRATGGTQPFTLWMPEGARVVPLTITMAGDTGTMRLQGIPLRFTMADGWLRRVEIPTQGVFVESVDPDSLAPLAPPTRPEAPATVIESQHTVFDGDVPLDGTLTLPAASDGSRPLVVIVAGSGPTDRDGNSGIALRSDAYAQLAWRLAERGIASFRYDKRGLGRSRQFIVLEATSFDDFVADVVAVARAFSSDGRFNAVVVAGHSEGAGLAVRAANAGAPVAGIALLAGIGRPLLTVLREQLSSQLDPATMAAFDSLMPLYLAGEDVSDAPTVLLPFLAPVNRTFTRTAAAYDPAAEFARVPVPAIIIQGSTDVQVTIEDAQLLHAANPAAELVVIPEANHLFKHASVRGRSAQVPQYTDPSLPVVPELVDALAEWIGRVTVP